MSNLHSLRYSRPLFVGTVFPNNANSRRTGIGRHTPLPSQASAFADAKAPVGDVGATPLKLTPVGQGVE